MLSVQRERDKSSISVASVDYVLPLILDTHLRHKSPRLLRGLPWLCFKPSSRAGAAIWQESAREDGPLRTADLKRKRKSKPSRDLWLSWWSRSSWAASLRINYGNRQFFCSPIRSDLYYKVCAVIRCYTTGPLNAWIWLADEHSKVCNYFQGNARQT